MDARFDSVSRRLPPRLNNHTPLTVLVGKIPVKFGIEAVRRPGGGGVPFSTNGHLRRFEGVNDRS